MLLEKVAEVMHQEFRVADESGPLPLFVILRVQEPVLVLVGLEKAVKALVPPRFTAKVLFPAPGGESDWGAPPDGGERETCRLALVPAEKLSSRPAVAN